MRGGVENGLWRRHEHAVATNAHELTSELIRRTHLLRHANRHIHRDGHDIVVPRNELRDRAIVVATHGIAIDADGDPAAFERVNSENRHR